MLAEDLLNVKKRKLRKTELSFYKITLF